jgi:hypothetical protein
VLFAAASILALPAKAGGIRLSRQKRHAADIAQAKSAEKSLPSGRPEVVRISLIFA